MTDVAFDVTLCLLLVSASIGIVVTADTGVTGGNAVDADGIASSLATSTATVQYDLEPGVRDAGPSLLESPKGVDARELDRTAHGSLSGLLARSTLGAVTVDGVRLTHARDDFRSKVGRRVESELPARGVNVAVLWTPFPGAPVQATDSLGPNAPSSATVHSATLDVPSGFPAAREDAVAASDDGFDAVARVVANRTVAGLFPPELARLALRGDEPVSTLMTHRYERAGVLLNASVEPEVAREETRTANADLAAVLAPRLADEMRSRYDTPRDAAEAVSVGRVTIVVRTWSL
ncbi:hypothetical protein E6P09_06590 [Haloferax mediterranei ATCC 33500]|uniref:Uncharacterized protein n=1 Tax=Haloferax mediterranei (strain ATCC 33500 / DSM 1411 / JCM 8866 / NBRC 14739 / NCIMB 2177 / R-4) TaxID=523841 RepID=I3R2H2_HALMT|nr:hypothetical protein [Haloferax mediterranei]AFK18432.1 hypothetical protein HFX_0709 [Haloferax mediterranei ATCC 33500]AHZ22178.1 hypothetical protein BM92_05685 [Haloferax mediterranei ATCC 33500]EMA02291.1 hypothetical protein C439_06910 [Haloferax mediterranei ATCC 33500]MDX5988525.1 hypothetical protein [Haloferax mediterranei ATCC 33500]QCQ74941.1 hypothetical protein E6P09_06590 [Haloferax mediterranei ATCC 33500]